MLDRKLFNSKTKLIPYSAKVWRMVETQEGAATLNIVDSMEEQGMLEELLDKVKPPYRAGTEGMHYLLKTAFRYPPLKYGSRFGTRAESSFFYASEEVKTCLAETAYYRFIFLHDMQTPYEKVIDSRHSMFNVAVKSKHCLDLRSDKFKSLHQHISHPAHYIHSQAIGHWALHESKAELITFESARQIGTSNVAIAEPRTIRSRAPNSMRNWLCRTSNKRISFSSREARFPVSFPIEYFLHKGVLPKPA